MEISDEMMEITFRGRRYRLHFGVRGERTRGKVERWHKDEWQEIFGFPIAEAESKWGYSFSRAIEDAYTYGEG